LLSLDNVGARFELERGGNWSEIQSNVQKFSQLQSSKVKVKLAVTINLQNVLYLDDIIHFAQASNLSILWWYLEKPQHLCIEQATPRLQQMIAHLYQNHADLELRAMAQRVTQAPGSDGQQFLQHMSQLDHRRQQRFDVTHKEVYEAMGGCMIPEHNL
jgi:hypothetical protein